MDQIVIVTPPQIQMQEEHVQNKQQQQCQNNDTIQIQLQSNNNLEFPSQFAALSQIPLSQIQQQSELNQEGSESQLNIENCDCERKSQNIIQSITVNQENYIIAKNSQQDSIDKLRKQLEFYFSDQNLFKDKFMLKLIQKDQQGFVNVDVFLSFNKIKALLISENNNLFQSQSDKLNMISSIKQAIQSSQVIGLNKQGDKVRRLTKYVKNQEDQDKYDSRTIYVENLPSLIKKDTVLSIFQKYGVVQRLYLPIQKTNIKQIKGYAFIEYQDQQEAQLSQQKFDGLIPQEIMNGKYHDKINLRVLMKNDWNALKKEFQTLKMQLNKNKRHQSLCSNANEQFQEEEIKIICNTLVKLINITNYNISKEEIKVAISHCCKPQFVDLEVEKQECIVRFYTQEDQLKFLNYCEQRKLNLNKMCIQACAINGQEETDYWQKINNQRNKARMKQFKKKQQKCLIEQVNKQGQQSTVIINEEEQNKESCKNQNQLNTVTKNQ